MKGNDFMNNEKRKNITMTSSKDCEYVFGNTVYIVHSHFNEHSNITVSEIIERLAVRDVNRNPQENSKISA